MLKTRLLLVAGSAVVIYLLFQLPKSVVENEASVSGPGDSVSSHIQSHAQPPEEVRIRIGQLRAQLSGSTEKEKNAIFADSLADLYRLSNRFDSAAWFAGESAKLSNGPESWMKAGDLYYQAYSIEMDQEKQRTYALRAQEYYAMILEKDPHNLEVKTKAAMTYMSTATPMKGIALLREVLAEDPKHELALFNMGMLSVQSGQFERATDWLNQLVRINPSHIQGQLLLGIALLNDGKRAAAKEQLEKVKKMDRDPAIQATVDSYLKDLK